MIGGQNFNINEISESLSRNKIIFSLVRIMEDNEISSSMDSLQVECELVGEENIALLTLAMGGLQTLPKKDEVWLALFDSDLNKGFLVQKLVNQANMLHEKTTKDETTIIGREKIYITNDLKGKIEQNAVLGQKLKSYLKDILSQISSLTSSYNTHTHITFFTGPSAPPTTPNASVPTKIAQLGTDQELDALLSQFLYIKDDD